MSWGALVAAYYFHLWLERGLSPWPLAYPVLWLVAVALTTWWAVRLGRRRLLPVMAAQIIVGVAIGALIPWERVFRQTWFDLHRTAFAEVARIGDTFPQGHSVLPDRHRRLLLGSAAVDREGDVLFLAVAEMKPERIGFTRVLSADTDPCALLNEDEYEQYVCTPLDDGWWWTGDNWPIEK
ncbi:hypothetical protein [Nonomuraea longicatena]|uniref:hypothetical protein n=1 Tax=Nonomuraea longicatena TaxID=83682 RepID=UPI0031E00DCD